MRPNILMIVTDQQRADTLSAHRSSFRARTPAMDGLVRRGVVFEHAFCAAPVSCPSRATLQTGLYPSKAGMNSNLSPGLNDGLNTVAKRMQAAGYQTVYHGKSHLKTDLKSLGYDVSFENSEDDSTVTAAAQYWRNKDWLAHPRPFFHILSLMNPHDIYFIDPDGADEVDQPPWPSQQDTLAEKPELQRKRARAWPDEKWQYYRNAYARLLEEADEDIARALEQLLRSGYLYNTWIILTSDHGDMGGEHRLPFKGPFMYDGVVRVPLVIVPPSASLKPGPNGRMNSRSEQFAPVVSQALTSHIDLVPTVLDIAGLPADPALPGRSLLPVVRGEPLQEVAHVFAELNEQAALRMIRSLDWKYVLQQNGDEELYALREDPHEMANLAHAASHAERKAELKGQLLNFLRAQGDAFAAPFEHARPA
ncbi:MAG: sulfatase-like hydrolase/transferase [Planctomycetes bacterium]|nr:sulfatase-like hydrolase/transferase [Planctomycetota bacterium]